MRNLYLACLLELRSHVVRLLHVLDRRLDPFFEAYFRASSPTSSSDYCRPHCFLRRLLSLYRQCRELSRNLDQLPDR